LSLVDRLDHHPFKEPIQILSLLDRLDHHPLKEPSRYWHTFGQIGPSSIEGAIQILTHFWSDWSIIHLRSPIQVLSLLDRLDHHPFNGLCRNCHVWTDSFDIRDPLKITVPKCANWHYFWHFVYYDFFYLLW
jgi:hypothetical protein